MSIPAKVRAALHERAESRCEMCWKPANNAHHRRNKSQLGRDVLSNLMLLCGSGTTGCHGWVTEHPEMAYRNGWSVRSTSADPALIPVLRRERWCLLLDDGSFIEEEQTA